jgi:hypothetical protein
MKKLFLVLAVAALFVACGQKTAETTDIATVEDSTTIQAPAPEATPVEEVATPAETPKATTTHSTSKKTTEVKKEEPAPEAPKVEAVKEEPKAAEPAKNTVKGRR